MSLRISLFALLFILIHLQAKVYANLVLYPAPQGEPVSTDYLVSVNNKPLFVYQARVSKYPINVWPGINRPLEQTELASFGYFDTDEEVTVAVTTTDAINNVVVRPLSYNIKPVVKGNSISFKLSGPCQIVVEVNGFHKALHLFSNTIEKDQPKKSSKDVLYFGPGIHNPGMIVAKDNQTIYVAGGAVVQGVIYACNIKNLTIKGRGIIDASSFVRGVDSINLVYLDRCKNVSVDGVILRNPHIWTFCAHETDQLSVNNIKMIGLWRYNTDGIDIVNSKNVLIENSFIRSFDDCIAIKGVIKNYWTTVNDWNPDKQANVSNVVVNNCILWNDWGRALEIGAETSADSIHDIVFKNCDIIHYVHVALDIQNGDRAFISNVLFENIQIEDPIVENVYYDDLKNSITDISKTRQNPDKADNLGHLIVLGVGKNSWSKDATRGKIENVIFKNIKYTSNHITKSYINGYSAEYPIQNVYFEDVYINNVKATDAATGNLYINDFVKNLYFK